ITLLEDRTAGIAVADAEAWLFAEPLRIDQAELLRARPVGRHQRHRPQLARALAVARHRDAKARDDEAVADSGRRAALAKYGRHQTGCWRRGQFDERDIGRVGAG